METERGLPPRNPTGVGGTGLLILDGGGIVSSVTTGSHLDLMIGPHSSGEVRSEVLAPPEDSPCRIMDPPPLSCGEMGWSPISPMRAAEVPIIDDGRGLDRPRPSWEMRIRFGFA